MTSRNWSVISLSISPGEWAGGSRPSRPRSWTPWLATPGRATSGSCKTSSNARSFSPPVRRRGPPRRLAIRCHAGPGADRCGGDAGRRRAGAHPRRPPRDRLGSGRPEGGRSAPGDEALDLARENEKARNLPAPVVRARRQPGQRSGVFLALDVLVDKASMKPRRGRGEPNCRRCVGPTQVAGITRVTSVDPTGAGNLRSRSAFSVSDRSTQ